MHCPLEDDPVSAGAEVLAAGVAIIVLAEAAHLVEDDLHLVPEMAIVALGEPLP